MLTTFEFVYGEHSGQVQARNAQHATAIVRNTYGGTGDVYLFTVIDESIGTDFAEY